MTQSGAGPVAILAGGGWTPVLLAAAAAAIGRHPLVFGIDGEADPAVFSPRPIQMLRWGEIGRLFRLLREAHCTEAVLIGSIRRRPDFNAIRPDAATLALIPRILRLLRNGDDGLLNGVAALLDEQGVSLIGPLDLAPGLALTEGAVAGDPRAVSGVDLDKAMEAAQLMGRLDISQGAVAVEGRIVAVEDAGGTDELLSRVTALRAEGRIPRKGGVLVKCLKPNQDIRLDVPTIGPATAEAAGRAGLDMVAAEAGRALLAGRAETIAAFNRARVALFGVRSSAHRVPTA